MPVSIRSNPCRSRSLAYAASSSAPAIQPVQRSMLRRPSALTGFWIVTSAIWIRPPGVSTRKISAKTASLSGIRSITRFEITTSKLASGNGSCSASLSPNSTFAAPISAAAVRAFVSISGVMSIPVTWPCSPTICAATSESVPAPEPMSSTRSPGASRPIATGWRPGERAEGGLGHVRELGRIAEVFGPGPAGREDEVLLRLLRDGRVRLLDLALQDLNVDLDFDGHHASLEGIVHLSGDGGGPKRAPRLPVGRGNEQAAGAGEHGDDQDRSLRRGEVGADPGDQGAEDETEVAPEAVHANDARPVARLARVGDGGDQSRVDHRRAGAKQQRRGERGREGTVAGDEQPERASLHQHPGRDQRLSARVVGEPAGQELAG